MVEHQRLQIAADLPLGPARPQPAALDQVGQRGVGGLARQPQQGDLAGVLDLPQRLDGSGGPHQFGVLTGGLRQRGEAVDGDHVALEAQPAHPVVGGAAAPDERPQARSMTTSASGACCAAWVR